MPSQAFIIRASPPPRGEDDRAESSSTRGRSAKWGLGQRSQPSSSSSSSYKGKTRFVRESKASRAWTGDWTREDEVEDKEEQVEAAPSVEKGLFDDAGSTEPAPPAPAADDSTPSSGSMASLYAQIAARIASSPSRTPPPLAQPQPQAGPTSMIPPRVLTKRKRAPQSQRSDWFIAKASEQLSRQEARKQQPPPQPSQNEATATSKTASVSTTAQPQAPSLHPCPTCSQLLPSPCPAPLLRAHLDSIAHRMAQSASSPASTPRAPPPVVAAAAATTAAAASLPRSLFLDASNAGYRALQAMGWKEGWGMGEEQWKRLQEEALREEETREREQKEKAERREGMSRRRREDIIVVSDSEDEEDEEEDGDVLFGPSKEKPPRRRPGEEVAAARVASASRGGEDVDDDKKEQPSSAAPTTEQATKGEGGPTSFLSSQPLLEPIAVQLKRDRLGLGRLRAATGRDYPTLGVNAGSSAVAADSSDKKRRREERQAEKKKRRDIVKEHERERREWLELRQSLN